MKIAIVGAGISGASLARILADRGLNSTLIESSERVGGMCREVTWNSSLVSEFGPHIFRSSEQDIWQFFNQFADLVEKKHEVLTMIDGNVTPFPPLEFNEANPNQPNWRDFSSLGQFLVAAVGSDVFERYYRNYTMKRWGISAHELSAEMAPLVPIFRYSTGFFREGKVGLPRFGYTKAIESMVDHERITLTMNTSVSLNDLHDFEHVVWTGRPDVIINDNTPLPFRSVVQTFSASTEWGVGAPVINYPGNDQAYIRQTNYEMLLPWAPKVIGFEYSVDDGYPAYPVRSPSAVRRFETLNLCLQREQPKLILHGRLGLFQYISMDGAIRCSFQLADQLQSGRLHR